MLAYLQPIGQLTNISMYYAPITVSGYSKHGTENVESIPIAFTADISVENNTAETANAQSDENGYYEVEMMPGSYNVTVDFYDKEIGKYSFEGHFTLQIGEGVKSCSLHDSQSEIHQEAVLLAIRP